MKNRLLIAVIVAAGRIFLFGGVFYTVDETEQVVITQFGKPVGNPITDAGLQVKLPFIQKRKCFPQNAA